ncbi:MAG: hypothetical protein WBJ45_09890 [Limnohabitans sp.]|uniref:hypothetical protein n=1 Tax=Limnohabitans sp. TaxID=1907725 RepID=UPI003BB0BFDA
MLAGVTQALTRGGFDVVNAEQAGALKLQVSLKMMEPAKGLRKGEVMLREVSTDNSVTQSTAAYTATLPAEPRDATFMAMGEAAATANVGSLREWIARK